MMKLLISNQYGAMVMALLPFIYGMLLSQPIWLHLFLLLAWFSLYLMTYPFLSLFKSKGKSLEQYQKWTAIYAIATALLAIPAILYNWKVLFFVLAMLPLVQVSIYYTKRKDERNLINDLVGITIFALAGMGAYYFPDRQFDHKIWWVALHPSLFFIGTTLYIKSVMRERNNPRYFKSAVIFHLICIASYLIAKQYGLALAFLIGLARTAYLPTRKLSIQQTGLIEFAISAIFFILLLTSTL